MADATIAPSTTPKDPGLSLSGTSKRSGGKRKSLVNEKLYVPLPDEGELELMRQVGLVKATFWGYVKEFMIDTGFNLEIGGVEMMDWKDNGWAIQIVCFHQLVFLMAFFYFVYTLTLTNMARSYLSLLGNSTDRVCQLVPLFVSGNVQGDMNGYWQTSPKFRANMSIYTLDMSGTEITNQDYVRIMGTFQDQMKVLSSRSALRDAAWNAMAWSTFSFADNTAGLTFYSSAFAPIFFDNDFPNAAITTAAAGICLWPWQYGTYNNAENVLTFNVRAKFGPNIDPYKYGYYLGSNTSNAWNHGHLLDACPSQFPLHMLYNSAVWTSPDLEGIHQEQFDVNSIFIAMSLNMNISRVTDYNPVSASYGSSSVGGIAGRFYTNVFLPPGVKMDPIFCVDLKPLQKPLNLDQSQIDSGIPVCGLVKGTVNNPIFYYPIAVSVYDSLPATDQFAKFVHCACPDNRETVECQQRNFVVSLFFDQSANLTQAFKFGANMQQMLVNDPINGDLTMQNFVTPFISSALQMAPLFNGVIANIQAPNLPDYSFMHGTSAETHKIEWQNICPWGTCGAVVIQTYKGVDNNEFLPLNTEEFQIAQDPALTDTFGFPLKDGKKIRLPRTMCENALYNENAMSKLSAKPPVSLVQPYFQCRDSAISSLTAMAGNAAGIANIIATFAMFAAGFIFLRWYNWYSHRFNIQLIKKMKPGVTPKDPIRNLAIPLIDKCKVDRQLSQITTDNHLNLHIKYAELIKQHHNSLTLLRQANERTRDQMIKLVSVLQMIQRANDASNKSLNPFNDFFGSEPPLPPEDPNSFFPTIDQFREMAEAGFETDNNPNIREMKANLERFIRCSTFNFSVAKAKIGAKEALDLEAFNEKKRRERLGEEDNGGDEEVEEAKGDIEMSKTTAAATSPSMDIIPVATLTPFSEAEGMGQQGQQQLLLQPLQQQQQQPVAQVTANFFPMSMFGMGTAVSSGNNNNNNNNSINNNSINNRSINNRGINF